MTLKTALFDLYPGDRFIYNSKTYMLIDFSLRDCSLTTSYTDMRCALDMQTYKVVCFCDNWEVELQDS